MPISEGGTLSYPIILDEQGVFRCGQGNSVIAKIAKYQSETYTPCFRTFVLFLETLPMDRQPQLDIHERLVRVFACEAKLLTEDCERFLSGVCDQNGSDQNVTALVRILEALSRVAGDLGNPHVEQLIKTMHTAFHPWSTLPFGMKARIVDLAREGFERLSILLHQLSEGLPPVGVTDDTRRIDEILLAFEDCVATTRPAGEQESQVIVDPVFRTVCRRGGATVILTPKEIQIVSMLASAPNMTRVREELVKTVWSGTKCCSKNFGVHLTNLRKKIHPIGLGVRCIPPNKYALTFVDPTTPPPAAEQETTL